LRQRFDDAHSPFLAQVRADWRRAVAAAARQVSTPGGSHGVRASTTPGP
jgi:hypothetical protein